jgi:short-subunit dehydrogenase
MAEKKLNTEEVYALVTGAGSGIGKSLVREMAKRGYNCLLVALRGEDLKGYARKLSEEFKVKTDYLEVDLSEKEGPQAVYSWVKEKQYDVFFLANNAGMAGTSIFEKSDDRYIDDRILVNIRALSLLTRFFIDELKQHPKGYILNVSSLSAFYAIPFKALYSSSKAFVLNFSRAIRTELRETSISVSVLCPNGVHTNDGTFARIASHGRVARLTTVHVDEVAKTAVENTFKRKFMIIPGSFNHFLRFLSRVMPHGIEQRLLYREFYKEVKAS